MRSLARLACFLLVLRCNVVNAQTRPAAVWKNAIYPFLFETTEVAIWDDDSYCTSGPMSSDPMDCNENGTIIRMDYSTTMRESQSPVIARLPGILVTQIGQLTSLTKLDLSNNLVKGTIPTEIGLCTSLELLDLKSNLLEGTIPTEIGNLVKLTSIDLSNNSFEGALPTEIGHLVKLDSIEIRNNIFSGVIPSQIGALTKLTYFRSEGNAFSGAAPPQLASLPLLSQCALYYEIADTEQSCFDCPLDASLASKCVPSNADDYWNPCGTANAACTPFVPPDPNATDAASPSQAQDLVSAASPLRACSLRRLAAALLAAAAAIALSA